MTVKHTTAFHDRFMIIDGTTAYHIGASIKDAGKKCFGINKIEDIGIFGFPTKGWKAVFSSNYTSIVHIHGSCYDMDVATDDREDLYI